MKNLDDLYLVLMSLKKLKIFELLNKPGPLFLSGIDLSDCDIFHPNLGEADLSWANLSNANMTAANLKKAILEQANFTGA